MRCQKGCTFCLVLLMTLLVVNAPRASAQRITNEYVRANGGAEGSSNRLCVTLSHTDGGALSVPDNQWGGTRTTRLNARAFDSERRQTQVQVEYRVSDPVLVYQKQYLGDMPFVHYPRVLPVQHARVLPHHERTGALFDALATATAGPNPVARRLLGSDADSSVLGEDQFLASDLDVNSGGLAAQAALVQAEINNIQQEMARQLQVFDKDMKTLNNANQDSLTLLSSTTFSMNEYNATYRNLLKLFTSEYRAYTQSYQNRTAQITSLLDNAQDIILQTVQRLDTQYATLNERMQTAAIAIQDMSLQQANVTTAFLRQAEHLNATIEYNKRLLLGFHEQVERGLRATRSLVASLDDHRLATTARRAAASRMSRHQDVLQNATRGGLSTFTSRERPAVKPLGYVPIHAGDDRHFVRISYMYSTQAGVGQTQAQLQAQDTDIEELRPDTLVSDAQRMTRYQQLLASGATVVGSGTAYYVHLRHLYLYCANEHLLATRNLWYTIHDLMEYMGPEGCVPYVNCSCWAVVRRERCTTPAIYTQTRVYESLAGSGLCITNAELPLWFRTATATLDTSITRRAAEEELTHSSLVNQELGRICRQTTSTPSLVVYTSSLQASDGSPGVAFRIPNSPSRCATAITAMTYESLQLQEAAGVLQYTVPLAFYSLSGVATRVLFDRVSLQWEAEFGGTLDSNVRVDTVPFDRTGGVYREADPERARLGLFDPRREATPLLARTDLLSVLETGPTMVPVYALSLPRGGGYSQLLEVRVTRQDGSVVQQELPVRPLSDPSPGGSSGAPYAMTIGGFLDCMLVPCDGAFPAAFNVSQSRYVLDTYSDTLSGSRQAGLRRHKPDCVFRHAVTDAEVLATLVSAPFAPDYDYSAPRPMITVDEYNRQESQPFFDPTTCSRDSAYRYRIRLQGTSVSNLRCNDADLERRGTGAGQLCALLASHRIIKPSPSPFPDLDESDHLRLALRNWTTTACFEIPSAEVDGGSATTLLEPCPDPNDVQIVASGQDESGAQAPRLRVTAPLDSSLYQNGGILLRAVVVDLAGSGGCGQQTLPVQRLVAGGRIEWALFPPRGCSRNQFVRIEQANSTSTTVCWSWSGDIVDLLERETARYRTATQGGINGTWISRTGVVEDEASIAAVGRLDVLSADLSESNEQIVALQLRLAAEASRAFVSKIGSIGRIYMALLQGGGLDSARNALLSEFATLEASTASYVQELQLAAVTSKRRDALLYEGMQTLFRDISRLINERLRDRYAEQLEIQRLTDVYEEYVRTDALVRFQTSYDTLRSIYDQLRPLADRVRRAMNRTGIDKLRPIPLVYDFEPDENYWHRTVALGSVVREWVGAAAGLVADLVARIVDELSHPCYVWGIPLPATTCKLLRTLETIFYIVLAVLGLVFLLWLFSLIRKR